MNGYFNKLFILFLIAFSSVSFGQNSNKEYRSSKNPYYWKNRKPHADYWQQDVHYQIQAKLNDTTGIIDATQKLTYWNNAPDTLYFVFFHLYQNAFQPGSHLDDLTRNNDVDPKYGKHESNGLGTKIKKITVMEADLKTELDNTILKVYLQKPLYPGDSLIFDIQFSTYFDGNGDVRRRMKTFRAGPYKHYDGVHWYPRICVYDAKFKWNTDQHLNREFYGDYGTFDIALTIANHYIVEATGELQNTAEVLPDTLRKKLDIRNFAKKPFGSPPSTIITPNGTYKTWKYHAANVHDFAFTADPTYRIGEAEWNGVKCIAVAQESHAGAWQNAASYAAKIIKTYSEDIGMYMYPKMVVADALDGMEYPMITLNTGYDPQYRPLFCHEIGHNWFFGMVGSNETYRAFLDEGFTQFLTVWSLEKLEGLNDTLLPIRSKYAKHFSTPVAFRDKRGYLGYLPEAIKGDDGFLNTHSDHFHGALGQGGGYTQVYNKTAVMLYNLQYTLGDSLFLKAMQYYFNQWKNCHPYPEDFRNAIIHFTKVDLNWFFDQWLETDKTIDYKIKSVKRGNKENDYIVKFARKGRMQMPLDFRVQSKDGKNHDYHIPNTWFIKKTEAMVLPKWTGWDKLHPTYEAHLSIPGGIKNIRIDTTHRLADVNILNNSHKLPLSLAWDAHVWNYPDRKQYELKARPELWYNGYDGLKTGVHINGHYMNYRHVFDLTLWFNSGLGQQAFITPGRLNRYDAFSYRFNYRLPLDKLSKQSSWYIQTKQLDGLSALVSGIEKRVENTRFFTQIKSMYRPTQSSKEYLLYKDCWDAKRYNNTIAIGLEHNYYYKRGIGRIDFNLRSNTLGSDYNYNYFVLKAVNKNVLGKFDLNTRFFFQYGTGLSIAKESGLYITGASPEELMENKYTRSRGFVDNSWFGYDLTNGNFQQGGGLNLRGYTVFLKSIVNTYQNMIISSGTSCSFELGFDRFIPLKPKRTRNWLKINTYLFADAGIIGQEVRKGRTNFYDPIADAGLGTAITIKKWGVLQQVKPLTIRVDFPIYLSTYAYADPDFFKFRWLIGFNRTF